MRFRLLSMIVVFASLSVTGCRQAEGPLPVAQGEVPNRIGDITRDLMNAAGGDRKASEELGDDLSVFAERRGEAAARVLAQRVCDAVAGSTLMEDTAQRLANFLWLSTAAREISERQGESVQKDVRALLVSVGVTEPLADAVAAQMGELQKAVSARPRRWYERL